MNRSELGKAYISQELGQLLLKCIGNDKFFAMLNNPGEHKNKLLAFLVHLVESAALVCASDAMKEFPTSLRDHAEVVMLIARGLWCLLSPRPIETCQAEHTSNLVNYKGDKAIMVMVRDCLKEQHYKKLWDEVLAKDSATRDLMPTIEKSEDELAARPVEEQALFFALAHASQWKAAVRQGALQSFESKLYAALHAAGQSLRENEGRGSGLRFFDKVLEGLAFFQDPASMNLHGQLHKLEAKVAKNLVVGEVQKLLQEYPDVDGLPEFPGGKTKAREMLEQLHATLGKCRELSLPQELVQGLPKAIFWHFRYLGQDLQAPSGVGPRVQSSQVGKFG